MIKNKGRSKIAMQIEPWTVERYTRVMGVGTAGGEIKKVRKASGEISVGCRQLGKMNMEPVARAHRRVRRNHTGSIVLALGQG